MSSLVRPIQFIMKSSVKETRKLSTMIKMFAVDSSFNHFVVNRKVRTYFQ